MHFSLTNENDDNKVFTGSSGTDSHEKVRQNTEFQSSEYFIMICHIETDCSIFNTANDKIESRYKRTLSSPRFLVGFVLLDLLFYMYVL